MNKAKRRSTSTTVVAASGNVGSAASCLPDVSVPIWIGIKRPLPSNGDILTDIRAKRAIESLRGAGVDIGELMNRVKAVVLLHRPECDLLKKGDWARESGTTTRTLKLLPARARRWADKIEQVNANKLLHPRMLHELAADQSPIIGVMEWLPKALRAYAQYLKRVIPVAAESATQLNRDRDLCDKLEAHLPEWIQRYVPGRFFYGELADLLTAAFAADREKGQKEKSVDPDALKMLHERARKLWRTPRIIEVRLYPDALQLIVEP